MKIAIGSNHLRKDIKLNELKFIVIMDYEKKYKEALQRAKHALDCDKNGLVNTDKPLIMSLFPELEEREDERIRKGLIENFKWFLGNYSEKTWGKDNNLLVKDIIAWLEKQGEHLKNYNEAEKEKADFVEKACDAYCNLCDTKECVNVGECDWVERFRNQEKSNQSDKKTIIKEK